MDSLNVLPGRDLELSGVKLYFDLVKLEVKVVEKKRQSSHASLSQYWL